MAAPATSLSTVRQHLASNPAPACGWSIPTARSNRGSCLRANADAPRRIKKRPPSQFMQEAVFTAASAAGFRSGCLAAVAQLAAQDLAHIGLGQLAAELHELGALVAGQALLAEGNQLGLG